MKIVLLFFLLFVFTIAHCESLVAIPQYEFSNITDTSDRSTFSPDNKILASGDWEGNIYLYSTQGIDLGVLQKHQERITDLKFLSDNRLLSSSLDTTIRLWDTENKTELYVFKNNSPIISIDITFDGSKLISVDQNSLIKIIDINTKTLVQTIKVSKVVRHLKVAEYIYLTTSTQEVVIFDFEGNLIVELNTQHNIDFFALKDGFIVTAGDRHFKVWDTKNKRFVIQKWFSRVIQAVYFFDKPENVIVYTGGTVYICNLQQKKQEEVLKEVYFYNISISADGEYLCGLGDKKIYCYTLERGGTENIDDHLKNQLTTAEVLPPLPGILILPVVNNENQTSKLGTVLSMMAMFYATYCPQKILNIPYAEVEKYFLENQLFIPQKNILPQTVERIKNQFAFPNIAKIKMQVKDNEYHIIVHCEGSFSVKKYNKIFSFSELGQIPLWLAEKIHEYLQIPDSTQKQAFWQSQKIATENIVQISNIYELYHVSRYTVEIDVWENLQKVYDENIFVNAQFANSHFVGYTKPTESLFSIFKVFPEHTYLKMLIADYYAKTTQHNKAIKLYLDLLFEDSKNYFIYQKLISSLHKKEKWSLITEVLSFARYHISELYWYNILAAEFYHDYAWKILPKVNGKDNFIKKMEKAEKFLLAAYKINPKRWQAPALMIKVATALQKSVEDMNAWFVKTIKEHPHCEEAYWSKFNYLSPRWFGDEEKMLSFARHIQNTDDYYLRFLLLSAHKELSSGENYYKNVVVWQDIKSVFEPYLKAYPRDAARRVWYWEYTILAEQYSVAAREYISFANNNQLGILQNNITFKKCEKAPLYFALADIFMVEKNIGKSIYWLEKALHYKPEAWPYQQKYIDYLIEAQNYEKAYLHLSLLSFPAQWNQYVKEKKTWLQAKVVNISNHNLSIEKKTLNVLFSKDISTNEKNTVTKIIGQFYEVNIVEDRYSYNKHFLIAEKEQKVEQTLLMLYRTIGKDQVEAYRSLYKIGKSDKDNAILIEKILSSTADGKAILKDINLNYHNRWNMDLILDELLVEYKNINDNSDARMILIVKEGIGNLEKGYKFCHSKGKIGIISLHNLENISFKQYSSRIQKLLHYTAVQLFSGQSCTVPTCPCSFNRDIESLDQKNNDICQKSLNDTGMPK